MKIALLIGGIILAGSAQAQIRTGNTLLDDLQSENVVNRMFAVGYISGVADFGNGGNHCIPNRATFGQMSEIIRKFVSENPEIRDISADVIVLGVLQKTWPCAKKGRSES